MFDTLANWLRGTDLQEAVTYRSISLDEAFNQMYRRQTDALLATVIITSIVASIASHLIGG